MSGTLHHEIATVGSLQTTVLDEMYALFASCYDCVTRSGFDHDLSQKDYVILLRDAGQNVRGFSTQRVFSWKGREAVDVLYSGDTIVDPSCWGSPELVKGWCAVAAAALRAQPGRRLYWLLLSKGCRTYLYMPLFFRKFVPSRHGDAPADWLTLRDDLGRHCFGAHYDAGRGIVRFPASKGQLKPSLADIPVSRQNDPHVDFFLKNNPRYPHGEELVCLTEITPDNTHGPGRRWLLKALAASPAQL